MKIYPDDTYPRSYFDTYRVTVAIIGVREKSLRSDVVSATVMGYMGGKLINIDR